MIRAALVIALIGGLFSCSAPALADENSVLDTERLNEPDLTTPELTIEDSREEKSIEDVELIEKVEKQEEPISEDAVVRPYNPLRPAIACPKDVETLTSLLIRDIPTYTNRVLHRSVGALDASKDPNDTEVGNLLIQERYRPAYIIIAGRPELEPLALEEYAFTRDPSAGGSLTQIFFTTLSRQYASSGINTRASELQSYHWLFLVEAEDGWWLAFMYSRVDDPDSLRPPTRPEESSFGSVGQAVQLWLRDCRAGAIDAPANER